MSHARLAATLTWVYAAGFGIPAIPVASFFRQHARLPMFFDLFPMYGGPWSARVQPRTFIALLFTFFALTLAAAWAAWLLWNGSKAGAVLTLLVLPVEAVFWFGFALPIPWLIGIARVVLVVLAWKALE